MKGTCFHSWMMSQICVPRSTNLISSHQTESVSSQCPLGAEQPFHTPAHHIHLLLLSLTHAEQSYTVKAELNAITGSKVKCSGSKMNWAESFLTCLFGHVRGSDWRGGRGGNLAFKLTEKTVVALIQTPVKPLPKRHSEGDFKYYDNQV